MDSAAEHIADYLAGEGVGIVGGTADWALFIGGYPAAPINSITIVDTGGEQANADGGYHDGTVQVTVRSEGYRDGYRKIYEVRDLLVVPTGRIIDSVQYTGFWIVSDVAHIGRDEKDNDMFTLNLRFMREA